MILILWWSMLLQGLLFSIGYICFVFKFQFVYKYMVNFRHTSYVIDMDTFFNILD